MNPMLSKSTTEKYRAACNVPRHGRDGFLRSLYGYVCGNITTEREDLTAGKYDCEFFYEKFYEIQIVKSASMARRNENIVITTYFT
jgi:hypothetical protein